MVYQSFLAKGMAETFKETAICEGLYSDFLVLVDVGTSG